MASAPLIHAHQASGAFQRWQLEAFDREQPVVEEIAAPPVVEAGPAEESPEEQVFEIAPGVQLPTAEDLERIAQEAMKEGYAAGYEEGSARGRLEAAELHQLLSGMDESLRQLDQQVAAELLALALEVARKVVRDALRADPEAIMAVIRSALEQLPQQHATIRLHPDDAALARQYVGEHFDSVAHRILEDDTVMRGGCLVEAAGTQIDAQVSTRWRRVVESLNRESARFDEPGTAA